MSDTDTLDPLADLGLDANASADAEADASNEEATVARDDDVEFGEIEIGTASAVPTARRSAGGSRFPFDKLPAPSKDKNGDAVISTFFVPFKGGDANKFRRSVQSATTQANRAGADEGKYFESRSVSEGGEFKGMTVYRTDDRPAETTKKKK
ncbi:hypothetical protein HW532_20985 [Kaustia mangrovi]|uniref:Uncharacterized protein n=1 Tax=Kaustia mangrovi TaxID=2593653 RepID=A0A7S8HDS4_9HYPH|nr:hypothetical protein [Kaustia mangrovi]QPC44956.1 hypothetical protein HW532_20985 [Kaustia mangrovi]